MGIFNQLTLNKIMENEQITMTINGMEYICTPKCELKQSEQSQEQPKRWRDDSSKRIRGYLINSHCSKIEEVGHFITKNNAPVFATEKQAKSALAMAQISQIMANDPRFGGAITDKEWQDKKLTKYIICRLGNEVKIDWVYKFYQFLAFHTKEQRDLFLEENENLVRTYFMLDLL